MTLNVKSLCFYCHMNKWQHLRFSQCGVSAVQLICLCIHNAAGPLQEHTKPALTKAKEKTAYL